MNDADPDFYDPEESAAELRRQQARNVARQWLDAEEFPTSAHGKVAGWRAEGLSLDQILRRFGLDPDDEDVQRCVADVIGD